MRLWCTNSGFDSGEDVKIHSMRLARVSTLIASPARSFLNCVALPLVGVTGAGRNELGLALVGMDEVKSKGT